MSSNTKRRYHIHHFYKFWSIAHICHGVQKIHIRGTDWKLEHQVINAVLRVSQNCPFLRAQKWHFRSPNKNSETNFISPTSPKIDQIAFRFKLLPLLMDFRQIFKNCTFYLRSFSRNKNRWPWGLGCLWFSENCLLALQIYLHQCSSELSKMLVKKGTG